MLSTLAFMIAKKQYLYYPFMLLVHLNKSSLVVASYRIHLTINCHCVMFFTSLHQPVKHD